MQKNFRPTCINNNGISFSIEKRDFLYKYISGIANDFTRANPQEKSFAYK